MGMKVTGVLQQIKGFQTSTGSTMYSLYVDGEQYGCGSRSPTGVEAGDTISFEFQTKGKYKNADGRTIQLVSKGSPAAVEAAKASSSKSSGSYDERQDVISRQAALNSAMQFTDLALRTGALAFKASAKPADIYSGLDAFVSEKMQEFYTANTGKEYVGFDKPSKADKAPDGADEAEDEADSDTSWR